MPFAGSLPDAVCAKQPSDMLSRRLSVLLSLSICILICILSLSLLHREHFSRTPSPPGSPATKYSDWCRQLGPVTNGKQSRAAASSVASASTDNGPHGTASQLETN